MMERKCYCVYIHISPSNKAYIGITSISPEERWDGGRGYFKKNKKWKLSSTTNGNWGLLKSGIGWICLDYTTKI